ncbi:MAG: hypothetical protein E7269_02485 [Lachnospiraceae bacterium]|nr:hypothetical protein [Lachnospiraceae bacterium]
MFRLIQNEYIKIFSKASTYVMLVILLICAVGLQCIVPLATKGLTALDDFWYEEEDLEDFYESELSWYQNEYESGFYTEEEYKMESELINFCKENQLPIKYYYGMEWENDALHAAFYTFYGICLESEEGSAEYLAAEEALGICKNAILTDDWKSYYELMNEACKDGLDAGYNWSLTTDAYYYSYYLEHDKEPDTSSWEYNTLTTYFSAKESLESYEDTIAQGAAIDEEAYEQAKSTYLIAKYRLDNDVDTAVYYDSTMLTDTIDSTYFTGLSLTTALASIISILMIIIAGGIIAKEFSQGTIKFYLINPISRGKLFWSKYLTVFSLAILLAIVSFIISVLSGLIFGASEINTPYLYVVNDTVQSYSAFWYVLKLFAYSCVGMITTTTLAFMISSLMRASSVAIGLSMGVQFAGSTITSLFSRFELDFGRYFLFANTDLVSIASKTYSLFPNHTISFALAVIAVHMVIFLLTAYDAFTRRDV